MPKPIQSDSPTDNKPLARLNSTFPGPHFLQCSSHQGYQVEMIGTMMLMTLQKKEPAQRADSLQRGTR